MKARVISRPELNQFLDRLIERVLVYAPVKDRTGANWGRVKSSGEIYLEEVNTREPAKGFIFPRCELILKFDQSGNAVESEPPDEQVVFGVRPCDSFGLMVLERFFTSEGRTDPYVKARLERTTVIGLACNQTAPTCFCLALGNSPHSAEGMDLLLTDLGGSFLAEPVTEKGEKLVEGFAEAEEDDFKRRAGLKERVERELGLRIDTTRLKEKLSRLFDHPVWEALALNCSNCGACTFLCPTCHCFDVTDETVRGRTARYRVWDSCQFPLYSRHGSGHNPRFNPALRYRNRVMDKFYYTAEQIGLISCVGCGRCISVCPAGIDIRQTVERVLRCP
ncbi:MAG: 4Fe-4S dicluster domain-containing protein [bacterium]